MRFHLLLIVSLILTASSGPLAAQEPGDRVLALLRGIEWALDREQFISLPPDTYRELLRIVDSDQQLPYIRERAASALSLYPNREVLGYFVARIAREPEPIFRRSLVQSLCDAFAESEPRAVEEAIAGLLAETDPHLRVRAARCLRRLGTTSAGERLERYRATIAEEWERRATAPP